MKDKMFPAPEPAAHRPRRPRGLLRLAFRLPVLLYRCHLDWLLGHRFLLLTHQGRNTGAVHDTMLEGLLYDPASQESIVLSGLGTRADWLRAIEANPPLAVRTGRRRYLPEHRVLTGTEVAPAVARWERAHPWTARLTVPVLKRLGWFAGGATAHGFAP